MYNYVKGNVVFVDNCQVTIECSGVGYLINASDALCNVAKVGQTLVAFVHLDVKENSHTLFGFAEIGERDLYTVLLSASGVGAKTALAMIGMGAERLTNAIVSGDSNTLAKVKGVSSKVAEKVVIELGTKISKRFGGTAIPLVQNAQSGEISDAIDALVSLGMPRNVALAKVESIVPAGKSAEDIVSQVLRGG